MLQAKPCPGSWRATDIPVHPALAPYEPVLAALLAADPTLRITALNGLAEARGLRNWQAQPLRFVDAVPGTKAADYELGIGRLAGIQTRLEGGDGLHDLMNAMVWLHLPQLKACFNQLQVEQIQKQMQDGGLAKRSLERDRMTLLDENGAVLVTQDEALIELVQQRKWTELFLGSRTQLEEQAKLYVFGHGLLQKCLQPFKSMTAKLWVLRLAHETPLAVVDASLGTSLLERWPQWNNHTLGSDASFAPTPLPIAGWPGWWHELQDRNFYADQQVFRSVCA